MNQKRALPSLVLLSSLMVLLSPLGVVSASHGGGPLLEVVPSNIDGGLVPGDTFSITVNADEVGEFNAYEITLKYNTGTLTATSATILTVQGQTFSQIIMVVDDPTGTVTVSAGLFGPSSVTVIASEALFSVSFEVDDFGTSNLSLINDQIALRGNLIGHETRDGSVATVARPLPTSSALIRWKVKPGIQHMHFSKTGASGGNMQTLLGLVRNTGQNTAMIKIVFFVSFAGYTSTVESNNAMLMPGEEAEVATDSFMVTLVGVYTVVGVPFNSAEGILFFPGENSAVEVFFADNNNQ